MRPISRLLVLGTVSTALVLSGCSIFSSKKQANPPAALVNLTPTLSTKVLWSVSVGQSGAYAFSPVSMDGAVYAASADGYVTRIDLATGKQAWHSLANKSGLSAGVGAADGLVVVGSAKGEVIALDSGTGKEKWRSQAATEMLAAPAVGQGLVIVKTLDNQLTALDADTGKKKWSYQRPAASLTLRTAAGLSMVQNGVFTGFPGGKMVAVLLNSGTVRWESTVANPKGTTELERVADVAGAPAIVGRDVCAATYHGRVACFDGVNGTLNWAKDMSSQHGVAVDTRFLFVADERSVIYAFAREGGASVWKNTQLLNRSLSAPLSVGRAVVIADAQGYVHWFDRENGTYLSRMPTDGKPVLAQPVLADKAVIIQSTGGALVAFNNE